MIFNKTELKILHTAVGILKTAESAIEADLGLDEYHTLYDYNSFLADCFHAGFRIEELLEMYHKIDGLRID